MDDQEHLEHQLLTSSLLDECNRDHRFNQSNITSDQTNYPISGNDDQPYPIDYGNPSYNHQNNYRQNPNWHSNPLYNNPCYQYQLQQQQYQQGRQQQQQQQQHTQQLPRNPYISRGEARFDQHWLQNHLASTTVSMSTAEESKQLDQFEIFDDDQSDIVVSNAIFPADNLIFGLERRRPLPVPTQVETRLGRNSNISTAAPPLDLSLRPHEQQELQQTKATLPKKRSARKKDSHNNSVEEQPPSTRRVDAPTENDILCGQSRICASHRGNCRFQEILDNYADVYDAANTKQEKMTMTKKIVSTIRESGGRFLKKMDGYYEEITTVAARDKVSHALRTKVQARKKKQQQKSYLEVKAHSRNGRRGYSSGKPNQEISSTASSSPIPFNPSYETEASITASFADGDDHDQDGFKSSHSESVVRDMMNFQREEFQSLLTTPPRRASSMASKRRQINTSRGNPNRQQVVPSRRSSSKF